MANQLFNRKDNYNGPVQAVILDLSGTALDPGCFGNVAAFKAALEAFGLSPTISEIRQPMGLAKRAHIGALLRIPRLAAQWQELYGKTPDEADADRVFLKLLELMPEILANFADPVPGLADALAALRKKEIKIGACTAYSRSMMAKLLPLAKERGFDPDCLVASDEVAAGRPWPWMCWRNCERLGVFPPEAAVKVGDTPADIAEGVNAGHWSVGVTRTSSDVGLTAKEAEAMPENELKAREAAIAQKLAEAGAHFVISDISELPALCGHINGLLASGVTPFSYQERRNA